MGVLRQLLVTLEEVGRNGTQVGARMLLAALSVSCPSAIVAASSFLTTSERGVVSQLLAREPGETAEDVRILSVFGVQPTDTTARAVSRTCAAQLSRTWTKVSRSRWAVEP